MCAYQVWFSDSWFFLLHQRQSNYWFNWAQGCWYIDHLKLILCLPHQQYFIKGLVMVRRAVSSGGNLALRRALYLTLIRSQVIYCCQIWHPYLIRESQVLERLQRRATKFILDDYKMGYKERLVKIHILPLTLWMEIQDILLFIILLKNPPDNFNLFDYVSYSTISHVLPQATNLFPHPYVSPGWTQPGISTSVG